MPNFRRKSCHQCRSSKLACDRKQPRCSRCERRSWPCRYSLTSKTTRAQLDEPQHIQEPFLPAPGHVSEETASGTPINPSTSTSSPEGLEPPQAAELLEKAIATEEIRDFDWTAQFNDNAPWTGDAFPNHTNLPPTEPTVDLDPDLVIDIFADITTDISRRANFEHSMLVDSSLLLQQRQWRNVESSLTSKIMLGDILKYPDMLVNGLNLPPFISPPCCGDELQCLHFGSHQCLLQPLVACASIIRMARTNSPQNKAFIWRTIYTEQQKLLYEHESYGKQNLIAAVQAAVLYTILHIEEAGSIPKHYLKSIIITLGTMTYSMIKVRDMGYCTKHDGTPTREDWICNESMWRITSFCYALNELFNIAISPSSAHYETCRSVRLPSTRSLWMAKSNVEWQREYGKQLSKRQCKDNLVIAHLREYARYSGGCSAKKDWVANFEDWCLDHDELGTLVWIATKLAPN